MRCCSLNVKEAQSGDLLLAGRVLICPGSRHLKVKRLPLGDIAILSDDPPVNGHRPSADVMFKSVAEEFGPHGLGVLMTGMGEDGANGLGLMKAARRDDDRAGGTILRGVRDAESGD